MCWRICIMQYKDVKILLCLTIFKICKWKFLALDFQLKVCLKGTRDVISSDLPFMDWHVHCPVGVINIGIEPTAHQRSLGFHLRKILQLKKFSKSSRRLRFDDLMIREFTVRPQKKFIFYFHVMHHFLGNLMPNSNQKSVFEKIENWVLALTLF